MSEESDDPEDNQTVVVHPLQWRSKQLTDFLHSLDDRYEKVLKEGTVMARKTRKVGCDSMCAPPCDAPEWAKQGSAAEDRQ